jgi:uncharacterized protein
LPCDSSAVTRVFGISDLHLSFSSDKPMHVFGEHWRDHDRRMASTWDALVHDNDVVLCPGDLSWASTLEAAAKDLAWIGERPGTKVLTRGNHDHWWGPISKLRAALPAKMIALQNDATVFGDVVISGSRLWSCPGGLDYTDHDEKIYLREVTRLELSLQHARRIGGDRPLIAAIHYPPFTAKSGDTAFSALLEKFNVKLCVYGHLHGRRAHATAFEGERNGVQYRLIACDRLNFEPVQLWPFSPSTTS